MDTLKGCIEAFLEVHSTRKKGAAGHSRARVSVCVVACA